MTTIRTLKYMYLVSERASCPDQMRSVVKPVSLVIDCPDDV